MDSSHRFPKFRYAAWLSAGIVSVMVLMSLAQFMALKGYLESGAQITIFTLLGAAILGLILGRKSTTRNAITLSLAIAVYQPALYALGWPLAIIQDLLRMDGIPGDSLEVMMNLRPQQAQFFAILIIASVIFLSSRLYRKIFNTQ